MTVAWLAMAQAGDWEKPRGRRGGKGRERRFAERGSELPKELLQALMDAADAPEAVSGIAGAMIDPLRTHIEAFVKEQGLS